MVWCPFDHCYYCGRCYREACEPVHGDTPAVRKSYRMVGIGALSIFGSGLLPLALAAILLTPANPNLSDYRVPGLALLGLIGAGLLWLGLSLLVRRALHARFVTSHRPVAPATLGEVPDPSVLWRPNRAAFPRRLLTLASIAGGAVGVDAILILWISNSNSASYVWSIVVACAVTTMIGGAAALLAVLPFTVPSAIGVAGDGVHLWYESPYDRRVLRDVMPWTDLNIMRMAAPGGADPATKLVRFLRIDRENAQAIMAKWERHRIVRTTTSKTASPAHISSTPRDETRSSATPLLSGSTASFAQHGTQCARCRLHFPGIQGFRLLWCKVDRFYVCRKCWEDGCQQGHGRGMKAVSKPARIASAVVIAAVFFALWYPAVTYDYSLTNAWRNAPVVPISSLQPGQLAKVRGTILPGKPVAWGGHEVYFSNGGWEWFWNTTDSFVIQDSTGQVLVTTENWYIIYNGPRYATYAQHTDMTMYSSGDDIQVVGTVGQLANGTVHLEAQIAAQSAYVDVITLSPSFLATVAYFAIPLIIVGAVAAGTVVLVRRRRISHRAAENQPVILMDDVTAVRDMNLNWQSNGRGTDPRRRIRWATTFIVIGAGLLVVYPGLSPRTYFGYSSLGFIGSIVLMFEAALVYMLLFGGVGHPSYVAVDDAGFRMWYDSPYDRHLNDTTFPWDDVKDIHMTSGKGAHWVLVWTTGEVTNLYMLNGRNLRLLLGEWTNRRMPALS